MTDNTSHDSIGACKVAQAYMVHLLTACSAVLGLMSIYAVHENQFLWALWLMGFASVIDAIDGTLARALNVAKVLPHIDGALLDNLCDFIVYVIAPMFFLLAIKILPPGWELIVVSIIVLTSAYQFSQTDAKTSDHFFKGFPCYWNIVALYLFLYQGNPWGNMVILLVLAGLIFVPIKYIYPSRVDNLFSEHQLRCLVFIASAIYYVVNFGLIATYPKPHPLLVIYAGFYVSSYIILSVYRTLYPLVLRKRKAKSAETT